jgi:hypothetical protein
MGLVDFKLRSRSRVDNFSDHFHHFFFFSSEPMFCESFTWLAFGEWVLPAKRKRKKDEQRSNQTHGEGGNLNQQGQTARGNPQVAQQTIHVFAVAEL